MTRPHDDPNDMLDGLLAGLGRQHLAVPDDLMRRVLADAVAVQAAAHPPLRSAASIQTQKGFWRRLVVSLGGTGAVAGLGTAAVAGIMLGYLQPATINGLTSTLWGETQQMSVDLLADTGDLWAEG
jgi:hypothetical protein